MIGQNAVLEQAQHGGEVPPLRPEGFRSGDDLPGLLEAGGDVLGKGPRESLLIQLGDDGLELAGVEPDALAHWTAVDVDTGVGIADLDELSIAAGARPIGRVEFEGIPVLPELEVEPVEVRVGGILGQPQGPADVPRPTALGTGGDRFLVLVRNRQSSRT